MLAAASCTSATTPTPNPEPKPTPNPEPKPDPMPNHPSGGMMGGDTNPGNGGGMDNSAQQLAATKTALTTLINGETANLASYEDYAKIKSELTAAYETAKAVSAKTGATLNEINEAKSSLDAAIKKAASAKNDFDSKNQSLITAYNALKATVNMETQTLEPLSADKYSGIRNSLTNLYDAAKAIIKKTLDPIDGVALVVGDVTMANSNITTATDSAKLGKEMKNADMFGDGFVKQALNSQHLTAATTVTGGDAQTAPQQQPGNYSFVGYSVDVTSRSNDMMLPNWNFAQRKIWLNGDRGRTSPVTEAPTEENFTPLTDVSWIYSLTGQGAKYTLSFDYYGPSMSYLYFPYKLVKSDESKTVGLQYTLNGNENPVVITFGSGENDSGPTPTVADINVAKVKLSNLTLGKNTIEFSVPEGEVAPMIGNMYLTSNPENQNKVYDAIFGNTSSSTADSATVTVDLLKGYSLAASWSTYFAKFTSITNSTPTNSPTYLVGLVGGSIPRIVHGVSIINDNRHPNKNNDERTFTIYVNAPKDGDYYISGSYLTSKDRDLKFSTTDVTNTTHTIDILVTGKTNWTTLGKFDTAQKTTGSDSQPKVTQYTIKLKQGLNKVVIAGGEKDSKNAPFIGNLTFTLNNMTQSAATTNTNTGEAADATKAK
ncbi:lipoprotein and hemagglutinin (VlhA) family protein [Mycoplasmoides gallisepticum]